MSRHSSLSSSRSPSDDRATATSGTEGLPTLEPAPTQRGTHGFRSRGRYGSVAYDVDTRPGTWVARQAARRERLFWLAAAAALALVGLFVALAVGHRVGIAAALLLVALVAVAKPQADRYSAGMLGWLRGARAEQAVGETLNELRRDGWIVMHDVEQAGEGNIDHIASGPHGVYLVETKLRHYLDADLTKAKRQAKKLNAELGTWVTPGICVDQRRGGPFRAERVWIVPREQLLDWLRAQHNQPVAFERLARFADTVDPG